MDIEPLFITKFEEDSSPENSEGEAQTNLAIITGYIFGCVWFNLRRGNLATVFF